MGAYQALERLLDEVGDDEHHPLTQQLYALTDYIQAHEAKTITMPVAEPLAILRFLIEQNRLDEAEFIDLLNGKQAIDKEAAQQLARRFHVHADLFL